VFVADTVVQLNKAASRTTIGITIGQAKFGKYQIILFDKQGLNPIEVGHGLSGDNVPDEFDLKNLSQLDGFALFWEFFVTPFKPNTNEKYAVTVVITQDGNQVFTKQYKGDLNTTVADNDFVRLQIQ
jgi:hypothetical protein